MKRKQEDIDKDASSNSFWKSGLLDYINNPSKHTDKIVFKDEVCLAIKDMYPKAKHHYLIIPFQKISRPSLLDKTHIDLIKHLHDVANSLAKDNKFEARSGLHAIPSMDQLHMHCISNDMDSPCVKNKKHWNSFTTDFFIKAEVVNSMLEKEGRFNINVEEMEKLLKNDLVCHLCKKSQKNIPTLKSHIVECFKEKEK